VAKRLPLTKGKFAIIDDIDFQWLNQWKWTYLPVKPHGYAYRRQLIDGKKVCIYMHRFILNAPQDKDVDHVNGNGLDNRRNNIRLCTTSENLANRGPMVTNTSGYRGVTRAKNGWVAQLGARLNGKRVNKVIGIFDTPQEASKAYELAHYQRRGEFAYGIVRKRG